jgi:phytoene dehydrogenase-like protein
VALAYDIIVVGAGSNSLVAAAYLAKAGKRVLVLEKNDQCGGGVVSIEIAPGFIHDPHSTGYYPMMSNPAIKDNELELTTRFGLEFVRYPAGFGTIYDDGTHITAFTDLDRSCAEIAKFSNKDADAYRAFALDAISVLPILSRGAATPPMPTASFLGMLESSALGRRIAAAFFKSFYEVIDDLFETPEVKLHILKWCAEMMEGPDVKGTGAVLWNLFGMAHTQDGAAPVGGARAIVDSLLRCIAAHGGEVRTESEVTKLEIRSGEVRGVWVGDELIEARDAVVANVHPWKLGAWLPDVDPEIASAARRVHLSNHGAINQQIALSEPPRFAAGDQFDDVMCVEFVHKDVERVRRVFDEYKYGRIPQGCLSPLAINHTRRDPSRAPSGQSALYLYHFAPLALADGGLEAWARPENGQAYADAILDEYLKNVTNIDSSKIIARHIETPLDHHHHSASMMNGDIFGIGSTVGQLLGRRPTPELAQYRVPGFTGFYLAGPCMHPGGTVTFGGRATAMRMAMDMRMDLKTMFPAF